MLILSLILSLVCVVVIMVAHTKLGYKDARLEDYANKMAELELQKEAYAKEAGYVKIFNNIYEKKRHKYEVAEERLAYVKSEHRKLTSELSAIQTKIADSIEERRLLQREIASLDRTIMEMRSTVHKGLDGIYNEVVESIAKARENIAKENDTDVVNRKIAKAWADYKCLIYDKAIDHLLTKRHPISFERAKDYECSLRQFKDEILIEYKETQYKYNYLLSLFPDLEEYIDGDAVRESNEEVKEEYEDRRIAYLSREEWESLSDREKSQRALDNYNEARRRTKSQVGRDYEEYIAHLFRQKLKGCDITMFGEQKGLADLGRDLIVKHKSKVYIVQCKRWAESKIIHEKHIMQLFGTTIEYCWDMKSKGVSPLEIVGKSVIPVFVTTTELSPTATKFAERLGVVISKQAIGDYPQIKCNIGKDGEMIYHLPFDQQYNSTIIEHNKGEFYAWDVEQAEKAGFRRAMKYYYN